MANDGGTAPKRKTAAMEMATDIFRQRQNQQKNIKTKQTHKKKKRNKPRGEEKATAAEDSRQARCGKSHFWITSNAIARLNPHPYTYMHTYIQVSWQWSRGRQGMRLEGSGAEKHCGWWKSTGLSVNFATRLHAVRFSRSSAAHKMAPTVDPPIFARVGQH